MSIPLVEFDAYAGYMMISRAQMVRIKNLFNKTPHFLAITQNNWFLGFK